MALSTCNHCRKMFYYISGTHMCNDCKGYFEKEFQNVRDFIYDNPGLSLKEISKETNVSMKLIMQWIREGKLEFIPDGEITTSLKRCHNCRKIIDDGRYCYSCKNKLITGFQQYVTNENNISTKKLETPKMRYVGTN